MNDAEKISSLINALRCIATLPEPGVGGASAEGQYRRAKVLAKIALRNAGVPADRVGFNARILAKIALRHAGVRPAASLEPPADRPKRPKRRNTLRETANCLRRSVRRV